MPFNVKALEQIMQEVGFGNKPLEFCRDIARTTGESISRSSIESWLEGKRITSVTARQLDVLNKYARAKGYSLNFYGSP